VLKSPSLWRYKENGCWASAGTVMVVLLFVFLSSSILVTNVGGSFVVREKGNEQQMVGWLAGRSALTISCRPCRLGTERWAAWRFRA